MRADQHRLIALAVSLCLCFAAALSCGSEAQVAVSSDSTAAFHSELTRVFSTADAWVLTRAHPYDPRKMQSAENQSWDLRGYRALKLTAECRSTEAVLVFLRWQITSRNGGLYESADPARISGFGASSALLPLTADAGTLIPVGHQRPWDDLAASEITAIELQADWRAPVSLDSLPITLSQVELEAKTSTANPRVLDLELTAALASSRAKGVLSFRLDPPPLDPFSVNGEGDVRVVMPDGKEALAWLDQRVAGVSDGLTQRSITVAHPVWRAFVNTTDAAATFQIRSGSHVWTVHGLVLSQPAELQAGARTYRWTPEVETALPLVNGALRALPSVYRLDGTGAWSPEPADAARGARCWQPMPFWNSGWSGYDGAQSVNFVEAARMDADLDAAAREQHALPLAILAGDSLGLSGTFNWESNPLKAMLPLRGAALTERAGFDFYARSMRYCIARWGYSRAVQNLCIATAMNAPQTDAFHKEIGAWLKAIPHDESMPIISYDSYALPLKRIGDIESFASAVSSVSSPPSPMVRWHADQRFNRATTVIHPSTGADDPRYIEITAAEPAAVAIAAAGTYQFGAPPLLTAADGVAFDVFIPADAPTDLRAGFHVATFNGEWFDAVFAEILRPGEWNCFVVDLTSKNLNALKCVNGKTAWTGALRAQVNELGVHLFSTHPGFQVNGKVRSLSMRVGPVRAIRFNADAAEPQALPVARTWPPEIVQTLSLFDSHELEFFNTWQADGRLGKASGQSLYHAGPEHVTCFEVRAMEAKSLAIGAIGRFVFGTHGDLSPADTLLFDLWVPPNAPADLRAGVHFVDDEGRWVETVLQPPPAPGEWTTFALDMSAANLHRLQATPAEGWKPGSCRRMFELGVHLYSIHPNWKPRSEATAVPLSLRLANVRAARMLPGAQPNRTAPPDSELGAPTSVAALSDAKPPVYKWYADERSGSPCNGSQSVLEGQQIFSLQATTRNATSLCMTGRENNRAAPWDRAANDNLFSADALVFQVWCPAELPAGRVGVHLRDRNGLWFDTLLPGTLNPNAWVTYAVDLSEVNVHHLRGVGHNAAWTEYSRQRVGEIGIHIFSAPRNENDPPSPTLAVKIRDVHTVAFESIQRRKHDLTITLFDPITQQPTAANSAPAALKRGELWQCHFQVSKAFENPFDPRECDLAAIVVTPSGKNVRVPAFFDQVCRRREATPGGDEIVEPLGKEFFTVRYRAVEAGPHSVTLELREGGKYDVAEDGHTRVHFVPGAVSARLELAKPAFTVSEPAADGPRFHGFVRCADDRRHFQFEDGTFFYPIGPCLRSPSDTRVPYNDGKWSGDEIARINRRGTYQYDDYIAAAAKNGVSWARVWMCSWWGGLEWRRDWPGYQGVGRYNLLNAWRMDHVIELAEQNGMEINLCLTNHGQFAPNVDTEWANNPYSVAYGGPLQAPREFFTRPEAKILHENKLRYVVARYGHSPAIMAWALFSECEFTQEYAEHENNSPHVCDWHAQMADYLKEIDPNKHLVTTHFSHPHHGIDVLAIPAMDFATSNAYSAFGELTNRFDAAEALAAYWGGRGNFKGFIAYNKPALVEEQGRHFMGGNANTRDNLDADLHAGIWGSLVQPLSGATGYWWWLHLHFDKRWEAYKPFAMFMKGEDLRPAKEEKILEPVEIPVSSEVLHARALRSQDRLYIWVYHNNTPLAQAAPAISAATLKITDLRKGTYHVQFWNTYTGAIINQMQITVDGEFVLQLPTVNKDIAVKVLP
jgi:hypothetical protein